MGIMTSSAAPQSLHSNFEANNSCSMAAHPCAYEESEIVVRFVSAGVSSTTLRAGDLTPAGLESRCLTMASGASFRMIFADLPFFTDGASMRFIGGFGFSFNTAPNDERGTSVNAPHRHMTVFAAAHRTFNRAIFGIFSLYRMAFNPLMKS